MAVLLLGATPLLSGCWQGQGAATSLQAFQPSGNGAWADLGSVRVQNATIVKGEGANASLIVSLFNTGEEDDALIAVEVDGVPATVTPEGELIPRGGASGVNYGYAGTNSITFTTDAEVSTYVPVLMQFRNAGVTEFSALIVPKTGYYEDVR
jgi:hypothetical protein